MKGGRHCPANVYLRGAGEFTEIDGVRMMVLKPCKHQSAGKWYCEAHQIFFANNATSWAHTNTVSPHVMVWICKYHGAEQPGD